MEPGFLISPSTCVTNLIRNTAKSHCEDCIKLVTTVFIHLSEHYEGFRHVDTIKVPNTAVFSHKILSQIMCRGFLGHTDGFPSGL